MGNRRFEMHEYRHILARMRQGVYSTDSTGIRPGIPRDSGRRVGINRIRNSKAVPVQGCRCSKLSLYRHQELFTVAHH